MGNALLRFSLLLSLFIGHSLFANDHLLISEVGNIFREAYIEIYNPSENTISLDDYHLTNSTNYYALPEGNFSAESRSFLASMPAGYNIGPGETIVIAFYADKFFDQYGFYPQFEIFGDDVAEVPEIPYVGSRLTTFDKRSDFIMLFYWDGVSNLVQDVDYVLWESESSDERKGVDKSGLSSNGDNYLDDTPVAQQKPVPYPSETHLFARLAPGELDETQAGGNGLTGHDETSEDITAAWQILQTGNDDPGVFGAAGKGLADIRNNQFAQDDEDISVIIEFTAPEYFTVEAVKIEIPEGLSWSQTSGDVGLDGSVFSSASVMVENDTIIIENANLGSANTGTITLNNLNFASLDANFAFPVYTRGAFEAFRPIAEFPAIFVTVSIANIQQNIDFYLDQTVTVYGVITVGINTIQTGRTNVFLQDNSGIGININSSTVFEELVRGAEVVLTGVVNEYNDVSQIEPTDFTVLSTGNAIPHPLLLTTDAANDFDFYDGTFIRVKGLVTDNYFAGGGHNVLVDDGSGELIIRVWESTGIPTADALIGDSLEVDGVLGIFSGDAQLVPGYESDFRIIRPGVPGDGTGTLALAANPLINPGESFAFALTISAGEITLQTIELTLSSGLLLDSAQVSADIDGAPVTVSQASGQSFRLDGLALTAANQLSVHFEKIRVVEQYSVFVPQETADTTILVAENETVHANQVFPVLMASATGLPGSVLLPVRSAIAEITNGAGERYLIGDLQQNINIFTGQRLTIEGRVTVSTNTLRNDRTSAFIQDESGFGINISEFDILPQYVRGKKFRINGDISVYNSVTQIEPVSDNLLDDDIRIPAPARLSAAEASDFDLLDGTYVEVRGLIDDTYYAGGGMNVTIADRSGYIIARVWDSTNLPVFDLTLQDSIVVKGVVGTFAGAAQLLPSEADDVIAKFAPTLPLQINLPKGVFAPDLGEEITIEIGTGNKQSNIRLRLFSLKGQLVHTFADGTFSASRNIFRWNGRDSRGDLVPIGNYILHLEVRDHNNANKRSKMVPFVIGTRLK
jgi:hypothetical protein